MANSFNRADFIVEACAEDHNRDRTATRASFNGLIQDGPVGFLLRSSMHYHNN